MATPESGPVLQPERNCWCQAEASRLGVIVDTADYFAAFAEACLAARRQILILGWDFDRRERLFRDDREREYPQRIGAFLAWLTRRRPALNIYLLSWDFNMVYAAERELLPALRLRLQAPPRLHFRLDGNHPSGASHHQKVVVIDDRVAFVGGIDLSRWRWDTTAHRPDDPRRTDPNGKPYPPFHDLMMVLEGAAAARLGDLARERWRRARGWRLQRVEPEGSPPWPPSVPTGLRDQPVALARTEPAYHGRQAVQEVRQLYLDSIAAARRFIYIENQYFTASCLAEALVERLAARDGPEVVLVLPARTGGWLEQVTMDVLRARLVQHLRNADRHDRLRIYYPHQPGLGEDCISLHSKLMIVDDRLLRIGSANTSARSMGLDTECDACVEAARADDDTTAYITALRHRLLGEHLGCDPQRLTQQEQQQPGLIAAIEALRDAGRSLRPLDCSVSAELDAMVPDSGVIDPPEPFSGDYFVSEYVPRDGHASGRRRVQLFLAVVVTLLMLAASWRWTPLSDWLSPQQLGHWLDGFPSPGGRALVAIAGFVVASLLMVPLTLLAVVAGVVFPGWQAFGYALTGALIAAALGFVGGRLLSRDLLDRLSGSRLDRLSRRLAKRGTVAVAVLRLVPIAPFTVFNLVAGSSHLGLRQFMVGSLLGLAPGLGAITFFSGTLWQAVTAPSLANMASAAGAAGVLLFVAWLVKRWLRSG